MRRLLLSVVVMTSCASVSTQSDRRFIEDLMHERSSLRDVPLPSSDMPSDMPVEVDELLKQPLTEQAAVHIALLSNREVQVALSHVGVARGQLVQAGLMPNPEVEFDVRGSGDAQPVQLDFGVDVSLSAALLAPLRAGVAQANLDAERLNAAGAVLDVAYAAKLAFLDVQAAQQRLALRLNALESQQASFATVSQLKALGNVPAIDVANQLAAVELSRLHVAEAENELLDKREALNRMLGLSGSRVAWRVSEPLPVPSVVEVDGLERRALSASLELTALGQRLEAASRQVGLVTTEGWVPHLVAGVHGQRDGVLWELGGHVAVGLPMFDHAQGRQLSAKSQYDGLRATAELMATNLRSTARTVANRVESAQRRAHHVTERLVPARGAQLKETLLQYNAMQVGVFELLQAQRGITETKLSEVDAQLDYWRARAALELLLAGRSTPLHLERAVMTAAESMSSSSPH